ncbi:plantaricin C family lantibiotic [Clostridium botulinum]|uniref:Plantaricin C family lantibiotic n=2 Tax=Clostridium TaxID=1485 RepID=A0A6M0T3G5_CLOBO|nr:plantaricin C family lantibiotic [Clostridium botulinum]NFI74151.1 plantaricin C family lantibiotic [Clostridium sporogenes]NFL71865.1 plantaricin C family lantibiotic [Clostridium sporogenes]NFM23955.1 plantaricin C family lantibiotic [Clostridium sporogenes]NFP62025.1 plantaricin C family lantibiotic [Clostridium sporogenes]
MLKNPVLRNKFSNNEENPAGDLLVEVSEQDFSLNISGGYDSKGLGNTGKRCSWSRECQRLCNWISYGSGGVIGC